MKVDTIFSVVIKVEPFQIKKKNIIGRDTLFIWFNILNLFILFLINSHILDVEQHFC